MSRAGAAGPRKLGRPRLFDDDTERALVMDAAVRVMGRNSYADMSVADVLTEAGLSTTSFYRHFDSKDTLVRAVILRDAEAVERRLGRAIADSAGPVAAVEAWLDGVLAFS